MKRFAVYISGNSGRLRKFITACDDIARIVLVVSDYEIPNDLKDLLNKFSICYRVLLYDEIDTSNGKSKKEIFSDYLLNNLKEYRIDYMFSFGSHILCGDLLNEYENKLINFHPSILPMFPGRNAIDQACSKDSTFLLGNTAHFIDKGVDTGPIIMQSIVPIKFYYDQNCDYDSILDLQIQMMNKIIKAIENDALIVEGSKVNILGADYTNYTIFPQY
jgi:phosphoribosylglycinamide formyltransferase-1